MTTSTNNLVESINLTLNIKETSMYSTRQAYPGLLSIALDEERVEAYQWGSSRLRVAKEAKAMSSSSSSVVAWHHHIGRRVLAVVVASPVIYVVAVVVALV